MSKDEKFASIISRDICYFIFVPKSDVFRLKSYETKIFIQNIVEYKCSQHSEKNTAFYVWMHVAMKPKIKDHNTCISL